MTVAQRRHLLGFLSAPGARRDAFVEREAVFSRVKRLEAVTIGGGSQ